MLNTTFGRLCEFFFLRGVRTTELIEADSCTETRNFQYLPPEKYGAINTMVQLVLRNLGSETCTSVDYWIERFKCVLAVDTESFGQLPGSGALSSSSLSTSSSIA